MTYADMITLLLCLFAVFLSITIAKKETVQKVDPPPAAIVTQQTVKPVDIFDGNPPFHREIYKDQEMDGVAEEPPLDAEPIKTEDKTGAGVSVKTISITVSEAPPPEVPASPQVTEDTAETTPLQSTPIPAAALLTLPEIVDRLKLEGTANIEQKGDRITTLEISSTAFFSSGSATLSSSGKKILEDVAVNLKSDKFKDYQVTVEGHTDDSPIRTFQFPSNWELSTARASAVVHFFIDQGISARKLRAAGYADTFPLVPNEDALGKMIPENQARNRRVVIKLEKIDKNDPQNAEQKP